ncbi:MAG: AmmeMemoRadiSam system radical SAM enzyme [Proteobacteria bacterium]|nr:AmmeMemoRadiSam system radical SAM enzyme [Pseudomonadota bacterium]
MKEAKFYEKKNGRRVKCHLCFHECSIKDGGRGICGVRENRGGTLFSLVYGKSISQAVDPIEKKPLFHFLPGTEIFSIATVGCNFKCLHCQNYSISQASGDQGSEIPGETLPPERVVFLARQTGCESIAYTYTEPTIFLEYALDTAKLASLEGLKNVFVTNGYIMPEALRTVSHYLDGANIDLKSFSEDFYRKVCGARLQPVLDSIRLYKELGIWIEVTTLVIPNYNDSEEELRKIARFIAGTDQNIPWHVTQFYPTYRIQDQPRTPLAVLERARQIGMEEGLKYVYQGNVPGAEGENTYCPGCGKLLIQRLGYTNQTYSIVGGKCPACREAVSGVGL